MLIRFYGLIICMKHLMKSCKVGKKIIESETKGAHLNLNQFFTKRQTCDLQVRLKTRTLKYIVIYFIYFKYLICVFLNLKCVSSDIFRRILFSFELQSFILTEEDLDGAWTRLAGISLPFFGQQILIFGQKKSN